ncbi:hypothetical protein [Novosphingobium mathurense]|uniref:Uncharacterized protein n=1 Tax=Novosphingobium mathurense TaxID=428990 RepID=A0A1U6IRN7_9SPHN|nr:hypothetical protein [Novosphingobium mathurense]SLK10701.1 hypothetical protein SAMN06295987_11243 [Novosphingobium mathurense]
MPLKIETDQSVHGSCDGTHNGHKLSVFAYLEEHVIPCIIDMDLRPDGIMVYGHAQWRRFFVRMARFLRARRRGANGDLRKPKRS